MATAKDLSEGCVGGRVGCEECVCEGCVEWLSLLFGSYCYSDEEMCVFVGLKLNGEDDEA